MLYELGLVTTIAISGWLALDLFTSTGGRRRSLALACIAVATGTWAAGDLLLIAARDASEHELALRINYLGICSLPLGYLAVAAQSANPRWWRHAPRVLAVAAVIPIVTYSCLFWDSADWFVDFTTNPPRRGPIFYTDMVYAWLLVCLSWFYFWKTAQRLRRANTGRLVLLAAGSLAPLVGNFLHVVVIRGSNDPTPVLLGFSVLCIRLAVIDSGLTLHLPLARADVLEQVEVGIVVADLDGRVVDANRAARDLARCPNPIGRPLAELVASAKARADAVVETRCVPLRSAVAEVGVAALLEDRTESRNAEQRLRLAARLESLGFLTAGIAHEVNNPLAFIRANLSQLEKLAYEVASPEVVARLPAGAVPMASDACELVADTQEGVERIAALVHRLKSFARSEPAGATRREPVDLGRVADTAMAMASVGIAEGSICRVGGAAPPVHAVEGDLVQIALNLLVNAVQASEDRIEIEVEVASGREGVSLAVRDRGMGIDVDALPRLFEPFFTTKPEGTGSGLGLSLSNDLAARHGGRLSASNREGGGAEFTLWLPIRPG